MSVQIQRWLFTVQQYHLMSEAGILREDERLELIEGEIIQMAAIGTRDASCVNRLARRFSLIPEDLATFAIQNLV